MAMTDSDNGNIWILSINSAGFTPNLREY